MTVNDNPAQALPEDVAEQQPFSPKACRKQAAALLRSGGRRMSLIWASLGAVSLVVIGTFAVVYAQNAVLNLMDYYAVDTLWSGLFAWLTDMLFCAFAIFLLLPILTGVIPFAVSVTDGRPDASLLLGAFGNAAAYGHALLLTWSYVWRLVVTAAVITAVDGGLTLLFPAEESLPGWAALLLFVLGVLILLLCVMLFGGNFTAPYLAAAEPEKTPAQYRRISRAATKGHYYEIFLFRLFFIVTSLLSLLTVGVALLACVLPLWLTAYVLAARNLLAKYDESERYTK